LCHNRQEGKNFEGQALFENIRFLLEAKYSELASYLNRMCRIDRFLPKIANSLECGSLLPPWSRYKGASKLAHSKEAAIFKQTLTLTSVCTLLLPPD
jgi:hypothetical protein